MSYQLAGRYIDSFVSTAIMFSGLSNKRAHCAGLKQGDGPQGCRKKCGKVPKPVSRFLLICNISLMLSDCGFREVDRCSAGIVERSVDAIICSVTSFVSEADDIIGQRQEDKSSSIGIRCVYEADSFRGRRRRLTGTRSEAEAQLI